MLWRPEHLPTTVILVPAPNGYRRAHTVDPAQLGERPADRQGADGRHVILADPAGEHRLWLSPYHAGARLAALIPLDAWFDLRIDSLMRFHRRLLGRPAGPPPRAWRLTPYRRRRLLQMLHAVDLRLGGATLREIAVALGDADAASLSATQWKIASSRSYVARLVRAGLALVNGGYLKLLEGD